MRLVLCVLSLLFLFSLNLTAQASDKGKRLRIYELPPFERAIFCTKHYEGWHGSRKHLPYIGYGHNYPNLNIILTFWCKYLKYNI